MKNTKPWLLSGLLTVLLLATACSANRACQYTPPQHAAAVEDLTSLVESPANSDGCEAIDLGFKRRDDGAFFAVVWLRRPSDGTCLAVSGAPVELASSRGIISSVRDLGNGGYAALITPDQKKTGEYTVVASVRRGDDLLRKSRTALVFEQVNERWGQPQAIEGLVNTPGWEDSAYITPDGEYLFTMYLPVSPSCLLEGKKTDPSCHRVQGKITEYNRPDFASRFAASRLRKDGGIDDHCLEVGSLYTRELFAKYSVYVPPMMAYGFRRQPDGSFAEPFPISVAGVSACVAPSGLEAHSIGGGKAVALMGLVDPAYWNTPQERDYPSLFTATIELGRPNMLATWQPDSKAFGPSAAGLRLLFGAPLKDRQDNPHAVINPQTKRIEALFWDSEHHDEDIFYRLIAPGGKFPEGPWGPVMKTPVFSDPRQKEIQPFFDGKVLTVTKRYEVASRDFLGGGYADIANAKAWGPERTELAVCSNLKGSETDVLYAVGDATYAQHNGKKLLYFVYLTRRANGLLDMNLGFVEER